MENFGLLGSRFPPGFRFHPTDQELITHYLSKKVTSSQTPATSIIADVDIYKFNPWELPDKGLFGEGEWFFFSPRDRKYPNGSRPNRSAGSGYWKATGVDKPIIATGGSQCLGVKKSLVFYKGRPPKGTKTDWVMHEYRLLDHNKSSSWSQKHKGSMRLDDWVLCRVRQKGSCPSASETADKDENKISTNSCFSQNSKQQKALGEERTNNLYEWSDNQLLCYLMSLQEGGGASTAGSHSSEPFSIDDTNGCGYADASAKPPQHVSSVLDSIKRKLSFCALDELMLLPPNKRLHYSHNVYVESSPTSSSSVDQLFTESVI
ncbi:uncharacterized protein A4U43_C01F14100 [Asparagus officinalis]|uniref:NAC domain-containing protein n=1 Tax=Asparagus officinalis TaxID=4686 RepID=A0A5P1FTT0_ASPOF|nr:protein ATAF2-like [Asparagus officinalis]ONK80121.1 uncharacterized protein A4U43_C01F14100 [Asparagus officinalis]